MRIRLVEDDSEISRRLMSRLAAAGFVIEHAPDAETALDWPDPQKFTTLVVDLGLPATLEPLWARQPPPIAALGQQ